MDSKRKLGVGATLGLLLIIGGAVLYSFLTSPEIKLARAMESLTKENQVEVTSTYNMSLDMDIDSEELGLYGEEETYFHIMQDILKNMSGTSGLIWDSENKIIEVSSSFGIEGEVYGEDVSLLVPFALYFDEGENNMAVDLDPYAAFGSDLINTVSHQILPNIPELQEELQELTQGEEVGEFFSRELNERFLPVLEEGFSGKQYRDSLDLEESIFAEDADDRYLGSFIVEKMLDYMREHGEDELVTEEDNWIHVKTDEKILIDSLLYALEEVKEDEEAREAFEKSSEQPIEESMEDVEDAREEFEEVDLFVDAAFLISGNKIQESLMDITVSFEEEGQTLQMSGEVHSEYEYGTEVSYVFYGKDREDITEEQLNDIGYQIDWEMEEFMMEYDPYMYEYEDADMDFEFYEENLEEEPPAIQSSEEEIEADLAVFFDTLYAYSEYDSLFYLGNIIDSVEHQITISTHIESYRNQADPVMYDLMGIELNTAEVNFIREYYIDGMFEHSLAIDMLDFYTDYIEEGTHEQYMVDDFYEGVDAGLYYLFTAQQQLLDIAKETDVLEEEDLQELEEEIDAYFSGETF
ncbi:hypothetical protein [Alkalicoccus daliensis]|uniref:Uncharacterized protein n=1 Tax=Alkalicoccus daliensis TaxID=745820 RepID=A0A1H0KQ92_9BACI|nr:hypothetical protein [Alkalicoccus daliensis]SDO57966.1 hypothetical protein SAMN04488053_11924 [Alkalicoccus daliensis]